MLRRGLEALLARVLWRRYYAGGNEHSPYLVLRAWMLQKLFRINAGVPWPVHPTSTVMAPERIARGSRTPGLSAGCHIDGRNGIRFGRNVWIGPHVTIVSMNHDVLDYHRWTETASIEIADNCWLGAHCIILPAVVLGPHTVVAAGAVITRSFPEGNQVLAGNPARVIKALAPYAGSHARA